MHTWIKSADGLSYSVGHYKLTGGSINIAAAWEWVEMLTFSTQAEADAMVSFLNGGSAPAAPAKAK